MAVRRITKAAVDALLPARVDQFLWDDELRGFGLKVTPGGAKSYLVQYRMGGRGTPTRRYTIGRHGPFTPDAARREAKRLLGLVSDNQDPAVKKRAAKGAIMAAVELEFETYAKRFLEHYVAHEWKASQSFAESILRLHVTPHLRGKELASIKRADVTRVFDNLPAGKAALRRNVHAVIRRLFRWAVGRGDLERSPMEGMETPSGAPSRDRVLSDDELRLAWMAAGNIGYPFGPLYRLLMVTGQRREEVAGMPWAELDRKGARWSLPSARAKNGAASEIHLSGLAIAELDTLAKGDKWPRQGLVLTTNGKTSVSGFSRGKRRIDRAIADLLVVEADGSKPIALGSWRIHDFRRTFATGMQRLGIRFEVTEAVLNHVSGSRSGVAGVYQRHDWKPEKRAALDAWAAHIKSVVTVEDRTNVFALANRLA